MTPVMRCTRRKEYPPMLSLYDEVLHIPTGRRGFVTDIYEEHDEVLYVIEKDPGVWVDGIPERDLELAESQ